MEIENFIAAVLIAKAVVDSCCCVKDQNKAQWILNLVKDNWYNWSVQCLFYV